MALSDSNITGLRNGMDNHADTSDNMLSQIANTAVSTIRNPIAGKLTNILFRINSVSATVQTKINKLIDDAQITDDNKSKVQLVGNTIVITVSHEDEAVAERQRQKIQSNITSINNTLGILTKSVSTLSTISTTIQTLKKIIEIQDALMSINPATKATFTIFKKAIKIVFLKDMLSQYANVVDEQLKQNKAALTSLMERFHHLHIQIKIADEKNKGNTVNSDDAEKLIVQDMIITHSDATDLTNTAEEFTSDKGKVYILKIEKHSEKRLIGRAYEKVTGLLAEQTAPSFISTPLQLMEELKTILNL